MAIITYKDEGKGVLIIDKDKFREIMGRSPDNVDALTLACYRYDLSRKLRGVFDA